MKAKLFLTASLFSLAANAQLSTINENFDGFNPGNATFPQKGWSAILPANPQPFPPAPMMLVVADGTNQAVQAYPGNSFNQPIYLITPQIVTPAGDKALSFDTNLVTSAPGTATIQIGVATNPTDMSTFTAVGNPIPVSSFTAFNAKVNVPASTGSYLVIRITPTLPHTAVQIDNVVYDTNLSVNDSAFSNSLKLAVSQDNIFLRFFTSEAIANAKIYSASGQLVTDSKIINNTLDISKLNSGLYFISIENNKGQSVKSKFIKK